jgi:hypothetical protein
MKLTDFILTRKMQAFAHRYRVLFDEFDDLMREQQEYVSNYLGRPNWLWTDLAFKHPDFIDNSHGSTLGLELPCLNRLTVLLDKYNLSLVQSGVMVWDKFPKHQRILNLYDELERMIEDFCNQSIAEVV